MTRSIRAYAAAERGGPLQPWSYEQREARPHDVRFEVLYCGICHTDLHSIGPWGRSYPLVPGHEMVGRVVEIGTEVSAFTLGDLVAVGPIVDSCGACSPCLAGKETMCLTIPTAAYDADDRHGDGVTRGGFAETAIVHERFVYAVPDGLDPAAAAPLLCAGSTAYTPLRQWNVRSGQTIGVIGIGGLGHLALKMARAFGAHVVAFTTSATKEQDALNLGAHEVVLSANAVQMASQYNRFDFILDTVPFVHSLTPFVQALATEGTLCSVGMPDAFDVLPAALVLGRKTLAGAGAGGTVENREMLEFCMKHQITADIELVDKNSINTALDRLAANDVKYRFVVDMTA